MGRASGLQTSTALGTRLHSILKFKDSLLTSTGGGGGGLLMVEKNLKSKALDPRSVFAPQFHAASQFYFLFISILAGYIKQNCHRTKGMVRIGKRGGNVL